MVIRIDRGVARFGLPGLLLGIALAWVSGVRGPEAAAQTGPGGLASANSGVGSVRGRQPSRRRRGRSPGEMSNGTLALITSGAGRPNGSISSTPRTAPSPSTASIPTNSKGIVKLEASRQYKWDLKLEHYNNQAPEPDAIKATVETLARSTQ